MLQILDVLIGLVVVYLVFSTAASAAVDLIETVVRRRGRLLLKGISELFAAAQVEAVAGGKTLSELVALFYNSPHIASMFEGRVKKLAGTLQAEGGNLPSYIAPERFAAALLSLARPGGQDGVAVLGPQDAPARAQFERIAQVALSFSAQAGAVDLAEQQKRIAAYFEVTSERFSGWYRRHVQGVLLVLGLGLALLLNVDTLRIAQILSQDPDLRTRIAEQALQELGSGGLAPAHKPCTPPGPEPGTPACEEALQQQIAQRVEYARSLGLPLGWAGDPLLQAHGSGRVLLGLQKLLGCLVTALAICMGAPFWFEWLNKLASVRTTLKPRPLTPPPTPGEH